MEPEVLLAGSIDGSFRSGLVSIIKSMGAWMDQELKIFDFDLSRNFESDTSSERPSTSIVENRVVPDCELHPEMNFELSDIATLEQRRAYKIELQVER
ncbi:Histidine--tRNA ligase [Gossypium arboreum]|uniref:Histidine--tRNA ligase n=1 Tax=Gossypium arboreum TaxID=29729 RepID=A0A0B0P5I0_GOSAR|nr:Histidine--tRNA ligase [Gossypium arboreum]